MYWVILLCKQTYISALNSKICFSTTAYLWIIFQTNVILWYEIFELSYLLYYFPALFIPLFFRLPKYRRFFLGCFILIYLFSSHEAINCVHLFFIPHAPVVEFSIIWTIFISILILFSFCHYIIVFYIFSEI